VILLNNSFFIATQKDHGLWNLRAIAYAKINWILRIF
jgi:hypothetical protein